MQKQIPTLTGFIIIVAEAIILFGGIFIYQYFAIQKYQQISIIQPISPTAGWNVLNNTEYGFSLKYPNGFFDQGHDPKILVGDCNYGVFPSQCPDINDIVINDQATQGGDISAIKNNLSSPNYWKNPNGTKQALNNILYCLYQTSDAAMMHVYNYYYYVTTKNQKCFVVNFATSTTNCEVYLPLENGNTEQVKNYNNCLTTNKNQPIIINEIINTFKFTK